MGFEPTEGFKTLTVLAGPRTRPYYATSPSDEGSDYPTRRACANAGRPPDVGVCELA